MLRNFKPLTALLLVSLMCVGSVPVYADNSERTVKVVTYNMYLGADFADIFGAASQFELATEVAEAYSDMQAGNVPERIDEIAGQIAAGAPDVVGLQEVALWRIDAPFDPSPATVVKYDFLDMLIKRLEARGLNYAPVVVQTNLDSELPGVFSATEALDIRYTDRIAIIARTDLNTSELKIEGSSSGNFATNLPLTLLGTEILILRGWTAVDVKHRGKKYRFVNAHLESFYDPVQWAQAAELLQGPTNTQSPVILAGDFNSDAAAGGFSYQMFLANGFSDVWNSVGNGSPGMTWPLSGEIPSNILSPSTRLDLILMRGPVTFAQAEVIGEDPVADLSPSGFRPSDHAGVSATVVLEP
jgi:endonuclease/exonuclease/phosphatase family metal-dependent hydrolase